MDLRRWRGHLEQKKRAVERDRYCWGREILGEDGVFHMHCE